MHTSFSFALKSQFYHGHTVVGHAEQGLEVTAFIFEGEGFKIEQGEILTIDHLFHLSTAFLGFEPLTRFGANGSALPGATVTVYDQHNVIFVALEARDRILQIPHRVRHDGHIFFYVDLGVLHFSSLMNRSINPHRMKAVS